MKKREDVLKDAMEKLDFANKMNNVKTVNDVFLNKKLFNTIKNVEALVALRRMSNYAQEDKKNKNLRDNLIKAHKHTTDEHKTNFLNNSGLFKTISETKECFCNTMYA